MGGEGSAARSEVDSGAAVIAFPGQAPAAGSECERATLSHARHYSACIAATGPHFSGSGQPDRGRGQLSAFQRTGLELENILAALEAGLARRELALLLPTAAFLRFYLDVRGEYELAHDSYQALGRAGAELASTDLQFYACSGWAQAAHRRGLHREGQAQALQAFELAAAGSDALRQLWAGCFLAHIEQSMGDLAQARQTYEHALALGGWLVEDCAEPGLLNNIALLEHAVGRSAEARALYARALSGARQRGDRSTEGNLLGNIAMMELLEGHLDAARAAAVEAVALSREIGFRLGEGLALSLLGMVELRSGNLPAAGAHLSAALRLQLDIGVLVDATRSVGLCSMVLLAAGLPAAGALALQASLRSFRQLGHELLAYEQPFVAAAESHVQAALAAGRLTAGELREMENQALRLTLFEVAELTLQALGAHSPQGAPCVHSESVLGEKTSLI